MVLLILHRSFQSICVPKCCSQKKRNSRAEGVWSGEVGGHGLHAVFSCETARNGGRQELGRGRSRSSEGVWGDELLGQDGGGTMPTQVPARSSSQAGFQEDPVSPSCFFTCLCCPAQISDCCCSIQLFRHTHLDLAFAVAQTAPAQTGTNWAGASLSRCPSTPHAALTTFRRKTFHCIQNLFRKAGAIREPGQSDVHARSVAPGRPASPASKNAYLLGSRTACGPRACRHQRKRGGCCSPSKLITRLTPLSPGRFSLRL